jgi:acyl carrier protein
MEQEIIRQKVKDTIVKVLGIKPEELKPEATLYDSLGADSTEMVEVIIALSKTFNTRITTKEVTKFSSINEIVEIIKAKSE